MNKFSIKNFRSLEEVKLSPIKPLNIFVGKNSAGKSSLLRLFPLLKQSSEFGSKGILLWSGKYVDFGDFETTVHNHDFSKEIELKIEINQHTGWFSERYFIFPESKSIPVSITIRTKKITHHDKNFAPTEFSLEKISSILKIGHTEEAKDYINTIEIELHDTKLEISYDDNHQIIQYKINNEDYSHIARNSLKIKSWYGLLPSITNNNDAEKKGTLYSMLYACISEIVHGKMNAAKKHYICDSIKLGSKEDTLASLKSLDLGSFGHKTIEKWNANSPALDRLRTLVAAIRCESIVDSVSGFLSATFLSSKYMTPLRPSAERFYRNSNIAVNELDPTGENIAMFLLNLGENNLNLLSAWSSEKFGFGIALDKGKSHISIQIIDPITGARDNIADTGFGHSQILPVIVQLWTIINSGQNETIIPYFLVIEQPELHLHPSMQGKLGRVMATLIKECSENSIDVKIMIETHSQDLINNIGRAIRKDGVDPDLVSVTIFEKNSVGSTELTPSAFDRDGFLQNWPFGFFDA